MKKLFLLSLIPILFSLSAFAQISEGTILIGASSNLGFNSISTDDQPDYNTVTIEVSGGYFVADNFALGIGLGYSKYSTSNFSSSTLLLGGFGRYYINGKFFLGAGYYSSKAEEADAVGLVQLDAGYAAFVTDAIAIEPTFSYAFSTGESESSGMGLSIGFVLYLNRN